MAVDVGRGQLAWSLRTDPRVTVLERTNVRHLTPDDIGGRVDLCTADLSFISLTVCAPALARCVTADADLVLLVKPQFEAGRGDVGKGGVIRDPIGASIGARAGCATASLPRASTRYRRCRHRCGAPTATSNSSSTPARTAARIVGDDALDAAVDRAHTGARS